MAYFHTTVLDEQIKAMPTVGTASGSVATFDTDMTENLVSVIADISASATKCYLANMSDITNKTYFEGLLNGTYGFVDLGNLNWSKDTTTLSVTVFRAPIDDRAVGTLYGICDKYTATTETRDYLVTHDMTMTRWNAAGTNVAIRDDSLSSGTASDFTTAVTGVYLIYELATPTIPTITASDFNTLLNAFNISGWCYEYDFGETVSSGATIDCVSGTLTRNDDSIKSIGGNILSVLSDNNIFASTGDVEVKYILSVGKAIS